jgi:DNA polymerase IV
MSALTPPGQALGWMFIDMNSYFASCEQQDRPALRGKPVAVVPMQTDSTCAIAASYEAKAFGIKTGSLIYEARRKCPELICVQARHHIYVDYHHKILSEIVKHTPIHKVWSVDELSSQLTKEHQTVAGATKLAHRIKDGLRKNVGDQIRCSIGVAPNSFLAKVGSDMQKPDGLVILHAADLPGRLLDLKLTDLPGINTAMERRLWNGGIRTMEDLWITSPKQARRIWGSVEGERFWYNLHGHDVPDRITHRSMIGHSRILDPDMRTPDAAYQMARRLTLKAASRLRRMEYYTTRFALSTRVVHGPRFAAETRLSPSQDNFALMHALEKLWASMLNDMHPDRLKKVSISMYGLCQRQDITPDLFDHHSPGFQRLLARHETISDTMDGLNTKFGTDSVRLGTIPKTQAGYVGTKIAFNRVPDMAEFTE